MEYLLDGIPICPTFMRGCHEMMCSHCIENGCKRIPGLDNYDSCEIDSKIPFFDQHTVGTNYPFNTIYCQIILYRGSPQYIEDWCNYAHFDPRFYWGKEGSYKAI